MLYYSVKIRQSNITCFAFQSVSGQWTVASPSSKPPSPVQLQGFSSENVLRSDFSTGGDTDLQPERPDLEGECNGQAEIRNITN
jgi:hypothetical protein